MFSFANITEMRFGKISPNDIVEIRKLQPEGWPDIIPDCELNQENWNSSILNKQQLVNPKSGRVRMFLSMSSYKK